MSVVGRWVLGALLALEAVYLVGIVAVVVPFGLAMDAFDDREPNLPAYGGLSAVLAVSIAVLAVAVLALLRGWSERPDRAAAARAVMGTAAVLNFGGSLAAVALAFSGEALFWVLAAGYAFAAGIGCVRHRSAEAVAI